MVSLERNSTRWRIAPLRNGLNDFEDDRLSTRAFMKVRAVGFSQQQGAVGPQTLTAVGDFAGADGARWIVLPEHLEALAATRRSAERSQVKTIARVWTGPTVGMDTGISVFASDPPPVNLGPGIWVWVGTRLLASVRDFTGTLEIDWLPTLATITACEQVLLGQESFSDEGYTPPEYRVSFSYVVDGRLLEGSYRATFPQVCGHSFEILYDPKKPSRNTGSDMLDNRWLKWGAGIIGIGLALLAIWLWGDQDWFHN
jgi:hypothetical protein